MDFRWSPPPDGKPFPEHFPEISTKNPWKSGKSVYRLEPEKKSVGVWEHLRVAWMGESGKSTDFYPRKMAKYWNPEKSDFLRIRNWRLQRCVHSQNTESGPLPAGLTVGIHLVRMDSTLQKHSL